MFAYFSMENGVDIGTNSEYRAASHAFAGRVHGSPVQLDELPHDGQPETESDVTWRRRVIGLAEALEHVWRKVRTDALARIEDPDLHVVGRGCDEDTHASALRCELDRIREQIPDHLLKSEEPRTWCDVVAIGRAYREILKTAAAQEADLIVMGAQGRGGVGLTLFGSTTQQVVRAATCPVLTVRG